MATELKNLKIGKQDPQLFEIPKGFTKLDMGGMMSGMMGGAMGREGMGQPGMGRPGMNRPGMNVPPDEAPANPEPEPTTGDQSDIQKAGDMMKKLFGQ